MPDAIAVTPPIFKAEPSIMLPILIPESMRAALAVVRMPVPEATVCAFIPRCAPAKPSPDITSIPIPTKDITLPAEATLSFEDVNISAPIPHIDAPTITPFMAHARIACKAAIIPAPFPRRPSLIGLINFTAINLMAFNVTTIAAKASANESPRLTISELPIAEPIAAVPSPAIIPELTTKAVATVLLNLIPVKAKAVCLVRIEPTLSVFNPTKHIIANAIWENPVLNSPAEKDTMAFWVLNAAIP